MRRRRAVVIATALVGAVVLGVSLRADPGAARFYVGTLLLAAVWVVGARAAGPLTWTRPSLPPVLVGLGLAGVFLVGGLVVREIGPLADRVGDVVEIADGGSLALLVAVTAVNGVAEEMFFRGALYDAVPRHPIVWATLANAAAVAVTGNPMLVLAAVVLALVVGVERRATGGVTAPVLTHVTWSMAMLLVLPALFG